MQQLSNYFVHPPLYNYDIYIDQKVDCCPGERVMLFGRCTGRINIGDFSKTEIIINDRSSVNIGVSGIASVVIHFYGSSHIYVGARNNCKVTVYNYGNGLVFSSSLDGASMEYQAIKQPKTLISCYR